MVKINIQIRAKRTGYTDDNKLLVEIDINNGHWKYWEDFMETQEKQNLTINNICKTVYLNQPVKDQIQKHDLKLYKETRELKVIGHDTRLYDNLLSYLNYRIDNLKEDYKKFGKYEWGRTLEAEIKLFNFSGRYTDMGYDEDITFAEDEDVTLKMVVVE